MQVVNYRLIISFWLYWIDIIYEEELICKFFVLFFGRNHNNMRGSFLPRENYLGIAYDKKFDWKIVLTLQSNLKSFSHVSILRFFLNCITILIWECFFKVFRNFGRIELRGKCPRMFLEFFFSFSSDFNFPAFAFPLYPSFQKWSSSKAKVSLETSNQGRDIFCYWQNSEGIFCSHCVDTLKIIGDYVRLSDLTYRVVS
jgi:hypothetical protein